jgi:hypothetical protein
LSFPFRCLNYDVFSYFQTTDENYEAFVSDEATLFLIPSSKFKSDDFNDYGAGDYLPDDMKLSACADTPLVLLADSKELQEYFRVDESTQNLEPKEASICEIESDPEICEEDIPSEDIPENISEDYEFIDIKEFGITDGSGSTKQVTSLIF